MRSFLGIVMISSILTASVASCGEEKKDTICACIASGNVLNKKANAILAKGASEQDRAELKALKADKKKKCKAFEKMGGPEMRQRMESCKE